MLFTKFILCVFNQVKASSCLRLTSPLGRALGAKGIGEPNVIHLVCCSRVASAIESGLAEDEDDDAPSGETERAIAAGLAKIARLDAKLSALAGEDAGEGDEGGGQKDATSAREARVAERRRERRLEKMANLRRALRAPALEDAANALGAFSADGSRRFSRLSPE